MKIPALSAALVIAVSACATPASIAQTADNARSQLDAFPAATSGQTRHVLELPALANEDEMKVELIVGQTRTIDCNQQVLGGELSEVTLEGWGYTYYLLPEIKDGASTMMGCPPGSDREAFVTLPQQTLIRYNSKLPVVLYTPEDAEVRYRLWRAEEVRKLN